MALRRQGRRRMSYFVYIIWSDKLKKFYAGSTQDLANRISEHNKGEAKFTSKGIPWVLIWNIEVETKLEAVRQELRIKKRGIKRFLDEFSGGSSAR
jgi:putative endonuclease